MKTISRMLAIITLLLSSVLLLELREPFAGAIFLPKLLAQALSPYLALVGAFSAGLSFLTKAPFALAMGMIGVLISTRYIQSVVVNCDMEFVRAFGVDWEQHITSERRKAMLPRRWSWLLPSSPLPNIERDVIYARVSGRDRPLLCDIWRPSKNVVPSGLGLIYVHGGFWHFLHKDVGTRSFFRHLVGEGHTVMDIDYRLPPETDIYGMVGDVKRAIVWLKDNAQRLALDPQHIVIAGASSGAHLALLAAYSANEPEFTPVDLVGVDVSVRGVVSYSGPTDLRLESRYANESETNHRITQLLSQLVDFGDPRYTRAWSEFRCYTIREMVVNLMGGQPDEVPRTYELASPITLVTPNCPPTLLLHGKHDHLVPVEMVRDLYHALKTVGVPVIYVELPQTEHGFNVALSTLSQNSPPAQSTLYVLDRFLALIK